MVDINNVKKKLFNHFLKKILLKSLKSKEKLKTKNSDKFSEKPMKPKFSYQNFEY